MSINTVFLKQNARPQSPISRAFPTKHPAISQEEMRSSRSRPREMTSLPWSCAGRPDFKPPGQALPRRDRKKGQTPPPSRYTLTVSWNIPIIGNKCYRRSPGNIMSGLVAGGVFYCGSCCSMCGYTTSNLAKFLCSLPSCGITRCVTFLTL